MDWGRFAEWVAVIHVGEGIPTRFGIEANALARSGDYRPELEAGEH